MARPTRLLLLLSLSCAAVLLLAVSCAAVPATYFDLAQQTVPAKFQQTLTQLGLLTSASLPDGVKVKVLRYSLHSTRMRKLAV